MRRTRRGAPGGAPACALSLAAQPPPSGAPRVRAATLTVSPGWRTCAARGPGARTTGVRTPGSPRRCRWPRARRGNQATRAGSAQALCPLWFPTLTFWGSPAPTPFADPPSKCFLTGAPQQRASAGAPGAHRAHLLGPARDAGCGAGATVRPLARGPSLRAPLLLRAPAWGRRAVWGAAPPPLRRAPAAGDTADPGPAPSGRRARARLKWSGGLFVRQAALAPGLEVVYGFDAFEPIPR